MAAWKKKVQDIVAASQESQTCHDRLMQDLRQIYDSVDRKAFIQEFLRLLIYPMRVDEKSAFVDDCLTFLATFTVFTTPEEDDDDNDDDQAEDLNSPAGFFIGVLKFVINILESTNKAIRARGCQFLECALSQLASNGRSGFLTESLWKRLLDGLVARCKDKAVRVRCNAVAALSKLQQPKEPSCRALSAIMFLMQYDPSSDVRCQCMRLISTTKTTILCFVKCCRNGNPTVRTTLYQQIGARKLFRYLTVEQRLTVIKNGLTDPSESVRVACEVHVVNSWMEAVKGNIPDLVNRLDMITSSKTCELLLDAVFKQKPPGEFVDVFSEMTEGWDDYDWVKPERVFCLRHFISFITKGPKGKDKKRPFDTTEVEEWMDKLVPSLFSLVEYVERYITKDTDSEELDIVDGALLRNFTVCQMIELMILIDKSDAAGRKRMQQMFEAVVPVVHSSMLPPLVRLHFDLYHSVERTIEWMAEVISDWTAAPTPAQPVAIGFPDQTISYLPLDGLNLNDGEPDDDTMSINLFKSLTVLCEVLKLVDVRTLTTTLRSLYENLVLPSIQNEDPATRNLAFRCLGLSCLLDRTLATKHIDLFLQTLKVDVLAVRKTAIEVLFDLLLLFRDTLFEDTTVKELNGDKDDSGDGNKKKKNAQTIVSELVDILDSDDIELHDVVAEGEAKLRLFAPKLLPQKRSA